MSSQEEEKAPQNTIEQTSVTPKESETKHASDYLNDSVNSNLETTNLDLEKLPIVKSQNDFVDYYNNYMEVSTEGSPQVLSNSNPTSEVQISKVEQEEINFLGDFNERFQQAIEILQQRGEKDEFEIYAIKLYKILSFVVDVTFFFAYRSHF